MPELEETATAVATEPIERDPFKDDWVKPAEAEIAAPIEKVAETKVDSNVFDADEYLKKELGFDSWEAAKTAKTKWDELEKAPKTEAFKFANEDSEKYFNAIKDGKEDDVYTYLNTKKELERAEKLDVTKISDAAKLVKTAMLFGNKDFTPDDVDFIFDEKFAMPEKPDQGEDQTDDEYKKSVSTWEKQVQRVERALTIEAKKLKPELAKFKSELVLPDIPKQETKAPGVSQEELDNFNAFRSNVSKSFESGYKSFDGFNVKVKDEEVEIPISYKISPEEQTELKTLADNILFKDLDVNEYFSKRWFTKDSTGNLSPNPSKIMQDLMLLEKPDKVLQAMANDAASKRREHQIKVSKNINVTGNKNNTNLTPDDKQTAKHKEEEAIWAA